MSVQYPDLENKFPLEVDNFDKFLDPSISMLTAINKYKMLYNSGDILGATTVLEQNPELKRCILNAESLNKIRDAIISLQRFYLDDVQQYIVNVVTYKGEYNPNVRYTKYNVVTYVQDGATETFVATKVDIPIGTPPTDLNSWVPITLRGEQGAPGTGLAGRGNWMPETQYTKDDWVAHNNILWAAKQDNINSEPYDDSKDWYAIIRNAQHTAVAPSMPQSQYNGDLWFKTNGNETQINVKNGAGYNQLYPITLAQLVKLQDNSNVQSHVDDNGRHFANAAEKEKLSHNDWAVIAVPAADWIAVGDDFKAELTTLTELNKPFMKYNITVNKDTRAYLIDLSIETMFIENDNGTVTLWSIGAKPDKNIDIMVEFVPLLEKEIG